MSAPIIPSPQDAAASAATASPQGTSAAANGASADANGADRVDYEARLRAGGEWAVSETKNQQSRADKAEGRLRALEQRLGPLAQSLESGTYTGQAIAEHLKTWNGMTPAQRQAVNDTIAGKAGATTGRGETSPREPLDAEEPWIDERAQTEVQALRQELQALKAAQLQHGTTLGQQALTNHFEGVAQDLGLSGELRDKVLGELRRTVDNWSAMPNGQSAIDALRTADGRGTVEMLALRAMGGAAGIRKHLSGVVEADLLRANQFRQSMATDVPSGARLDGSEPPVRYRDGHEAAEQSLLKALRDPEVTRNTRA